jgi:hypothetical protein
LKTDFKRTMSDSVSGVSVAKICPQAGFEESLSVCQYNWLIGRVPIEVYMALPKQFALSTLLLLMLLAGGMFSR